MGSSATGLPARVDLWAPMPLDDLPPTLRDAAAQGDWAGLREQLRTVMDGVTTDGRYGRELLQFVMTVPMPSDPVTERYKASICIDHGDWDGLQRHLALNPIGAAELIGIRDIILAPTDRKAPPRAGAEHERLQVKAYEGEFQGA